MFYLIILKIITEQSYTIMNQSLIRNLRIRTTSADIEYLLSFDGAETAIRTCHASSTEPYTGVNKMQAIKFVAVKDVLFKIGSFLKGH